MSHPLVALFPASKGFRTFNAGSLANKLIETPEYKKLGYQIRLAIQYRSICTDLKSALESCDILMTMAAEPGNVILDQAKRATAFALLCHAIVFYSRGLKTASKKRITHDLTSKLSEDELKVHEEIYALRNTAIAHFGADSTRDEDREDWARETAAFRTDPMGAKLGIIYSRKQFEHQLADRIQKQVSRALSIMEQVADARRNEAQQALIEALIADPDLIEQLAAEEFDSERFMQGGVSARVPLRPGRNEEQRAALEQFLREHGLSYNPPEPDG